MAENRNQVTEGISGRSAERKIIVKKFGGTSVGNVERIKNVARLVNEYLLDNPDHDVVVVVSAMSGETNKLIELAKSCVDNPPPRELDVLLATGEQVTISLTAMALQELGRPAESLVAQQVRISTDSHHLNAQIQDIECSRLKAVLNRGAVPVVAGFQGIDEDDNLTTLGRGGSDITAVAVAAALKASACYIYTDVEGVYSTDPRVCRNAVRLNRVCHEEMLEMASLGAKVLHPRSVYFAMTYGVPLVVLSTFNPGPQTWIVKEEELMEKPVVTGITYRENEARITVQGLRDGTLSLSRCMDLMAKEGIFIDMITQAPGEQPNSANSVSFTVPEDVSSKALSVINESLEIIGVSGVTLDRQIAKVSVVGVGMRYHTGVAAKMFTALAKEGIPVEMIGTSEIKISVIVPVKYWEVAVRTLHEAFIENGSEGVTQER